VRTARGGGRARRAHLVARPQACRGVPVAAAAAVAGPGLGRARVRRWRPGRGRRAHSAPALLVVAVAGLRPRTQVCSTNPARPSWTSAPSALVLGLRCAAMTLRHRMQVPDAQRLVCSPPPHATWTAGRAASTHVQPCSTSLDQQGHRKTTTAPGAGAAPAAAAGALPRRAGSQPARAPAPAAPSAPLHAHTRLSTSHARPCAARSGPPARAPHASGYRDSPRAQLHSWRGKLARTPAAGQSVP